MRLEPAISSTGRTPLSGRAMPRHVATTSTDRNTTNRDRGSGGSSINEGIIAAHAQRRQRTKIKKEQRVSVTFAMSSKGQTVRALLRVVSGQVFNPRGSCRGKAGENVAQKFSENSEPKCTKAGMHRPSRHYYGAVLVQCTSTATGTHG